MMLCVNNENGASTGLLRQIEIDSQNDIVLSAEGDAIPFGHYTHGIVIGPINVACWRYQYFVGNILWNCAHVSTRSALRILNYLAEQHWTLLEAATYLWGKWGALTEQDLQEVLEC